MQILLVAGLKIVLFTSKHTVTNIMSVHKPSADVRLLPSTLVPRQTIQGTVIRSNRRRYGDRYKINAKQRDKKGFTTTTTVL